jgi:hypothetical protein
VNNAVKTRIKRLARWLKRETARLGYHSRPSFIIIGAQKAGTSALFSMLGQHPQIVAPRVKEIDFFSGLKIKDGDLLTYHSMFPLPYRLASDKITFEATPNYLCHPECAPRIHDYAPDMRLIAILRDPVARAYSAWNMYRGFANSSNAGFRKLAESRTFEAAITDDINMMEQAEYSNSPCTYVRRGIYVEQLQRYFRCFSREALLILDYYDFLHTPDTCLASVCRFLKIDETFKFRIERRNVSNYESDIPKAAADLLRSFYAPHNESLFRLLGREFKW